MVKQAILLLLVLAGAAYAQSQSSPAMGMPASHTVSPSVPQAITTTLGVRRNVKPVDNSPADAKETLPGEVVPLRQPRAGKRDPFISPVVSRPSGPVPGCATGKRCLVIDQMVLKGVVQTANGMIAVVANSANKAYFLREKDPVFNGYVLRISAEAVVFKENTVDRIGRTGTREVVKKVSAPAV
jgi:hypothetical protein